MDSLPVTAMTCRAKVNKFNLAISIHTVNESWHIGRRKESSGLDIEPPFVPFAPDFLGRIEEEQDEEEQEEEERDQVGSLERTKNNNSPFNNMGMERHTELIYFEVGDVRSHSQTDFLRLEFNFGEKKVCLKADVHTYLRAKKSTQKNGQAMLVKIRPPMTKRYDHTSL